MNTMILSALTAFGIAGLFGLVQSEPKKAQEECCAKPTESCCSPKPDNCCEQMHHGMKDHHPSGTGQAEKKPVDSHCESKVPKAGEGSGCMK